MSDYDFPELPSDEELGITDEDREQYEQDFPDDGPEMSDAEMAALLGEAAVPKKPASGADQSAARKEASKAVRKAEKKQSKDEKRAAREQKKAAKEEAKQAKARQKEDRAAARTAAAEERKKAAAEESAVPAWRGPATLLLLVLMAAFASSRTGIPRPVPANAPDTAFSSARAMATLVELAQEPHPPGSPEHARVREMIVSRLAELGIESEIQTTTSVLPTPRTRSQDGTSVVRLSDFARTATVRNVIARIPGTTSTGTLLVTAHYDSRVAAVGAGDDGSGVVTILEAVRAIQAAGPLRNDLILLFTDAEELGLLGARAFVDQHRWMADVDLVLSFEMRGGGGPSIMFETNEDNGWVVGAYADFAPAPVAYSLAYEVYKRMPNDTDFTPFREAGVQGMNFAAIDNAHVYHQRMDTPDNLAENTLQHHGVNALSAIRWFGDADLTSVDAPNRVYFSVPVLGLVDYGQPLVHLITALLVVLVLVFAGVARRKGARPLGAVAGFAIAVALAAAGFGIGSALLDQVAGQHPEVGALHGSLLHHEGWYVLSVALALLALTVGVVGIARRWISRDELALGALVLPVVGAVALGVVAPLAAVHLQIPALAAALAAVVVSLLGTRATGVVGWGVSLLLALPVLLVLQPVVELVWLALTLQLLGGLAVLMALGFTMCLPALDALRTPNPWWAPATLLVAAGLSMGLGLLGNRPSPDRPLPTTLAYAYEHGSGEALWVTSEADEGASGGTAAHEWAEARAGGAFEESRDLSGFGYLERVVPVRRAPVVSAAPPRVDVLEDSIVGSERHVRLGVRSVIGAEMLGFRMTDGTRLRALNGVRLENADALRRADHWGVPEGPVTLELTMPADEAIGVNVIEHLLRPWELVGDEAFSRPAHMAPNVNRLSDRAMLRYSVAAFSDPRHAFMRLPGRPDAGMPGDSLGVGTPAAADTLPARDTAVVDTTAADTIAVDTTAVDTTAVDTTTTDTTAVDTIAVDPAAADPTRVDTTTHPNAERNR